MTTAAGHALDSAIDALVALRNGGAPEQAHDAAQAILAQGSRVIVTGMGKCSHIGAKIAATLRSTGQPAAFLHPGEALHGDLGMVMSGDVLLALSNSGETEEVLHVAEHVLGRACLLIVITSKPESPLALMAEHKLLVPAGREGCPLGRAPMASSLAMLALGDALAASLMVLRGFTEAEFLRYHHGGYLGRQLRQVA